MIIIITLLKKIFYYNYMLSNDSDNYFIKSILIFNTY